MPQTLNRDWFVVIGDREFKLTPAQAEVLKKSIKEDYKGFIAFNDLFINISFISAFYMEKNEFDDYQVIGKEIVPNENI